MKFPLIQTWHKFTRLHPYTRACNSNQQQNPMELGTYKFHYKLFRVTSLNSNIIKYAPCELLYVLKLMTYLHKSNLMHYNQMKGVEIAEDMPKTNTILTDCLLHLPCT